MDAAKSLNLAVFDFEIFLKRLFAADFLPRGHCFLWRSDVMKLHAVSDAAIALAYYLIPAILLTVYIRRKTLPFSWAFPFFGSFIFLCGTTHLFNIYTLWVPVYGVEGIVKLVTAVVSIVTAVVIIRAAPKILTFPSVDQIIGDLTQKTAALSQVNDELERFNRLAIGREKRIIQLKQEVNHLSRLLQRVPPYAVTLGEEKDVT